MIKLAVWGILLGVLVALTIVRGLKHQRVPAFRMLLIAVLFGSVIGTGSYHRLSVRFDQPVINPQLGWKIPLALLPSTDLIQFSRSAAHSALRDTGGVPQGLPVRLQIPVIGVDSAVEDALVTPDGRMDVPAGSVNVAWFSLGPVPGQAGSAVIGGHFGITNGVPFVFYDLNKLVIGDKIYVLNDKGETLAFQVRAIRSFNRDADATTIFTSQDGLAHLNLITCEGIWNMVNDTYPQRLVVFTDEIPSEGPVVVAPTTTPVPAPFPSPEVTIRSAGSLFGTPLDALVSSLLFLSVAFMTVKVIRP